MQKERARGRAHLSPGRRLLLKGLFVLLIVESFVYKSIAEDLLGSTLYHYVLSAVICSSLVIIYITSFRTSHIRKDVSITVAAVMLVVWQITISLFHTPVLENISAALLLGLLVATFMFVMPKVGEVCGMKGWYTVYVASAFAVLLSIAALTVTPGTTFEDDSGRFRGILVSTAVASNVFLFSVLFSAVSVSRARSIHLVLLHLLVLAASLVSLILTASRGSLVFAVIGLVWISIWNNVSSTLHRIVATLAAITVVTLGVVVTIDLEPKLRDDLAVFMRWEGLSSAESRMANWLFGIERVIVAPFVGEGLMTKYTAGGTEMIGIISESTYDQLYDPHSVILYLANVGGVPLLLITISLFILVWRRASNSMQRMPWLEKDRRVLYMATVILFVLMIPTGGSLVSFGSLVDRVWWLLLGELYLHSQKERAA